MSNSDFGWKLALQDAVIFFRWDLKTLSIKDSEYEFKQKMILIVISTISQFWAPTLTSFC